MIPSVFAAEIKERGDMSSRFFSVSSTTLPEMTWLCLGGRQTRLVVSPFGLKWPISWFFLWFLSGSEQTSTLGRII
jgi:hypothetical protein